MPQEFPLRTGLEREGLRYKTGAACLCRGGGWILVVTVYVYYF